jgi:vancomycin resistance protein YoaR
LVGIVLVAIVSGPIWIPQFVFANQVLPKVSLLDVNLGGQSQMMATASMRDITSRANLKPIELNFDGGIWEINPADFKLKVEPDRLASVAMSVGRRGGFSQRLVESWAGLLNISQPLVVADESLYDFDRLALTKQLEEITKDIIQPRRDAKMKIVNNRATEFIAPKSGHELDMNRAVDLIAGSILANNRTIDLPVQVTEPAVTLADTNKLGINTLLGHGESDFSGSPKNRRHNIQAGASKFDGVIIPPKETFSFIKQLGVVDASTGYLPELVIKGDKTTPEFGGGLCQVSTTAFRGILRTGLPITERHNHSYRVVYYEPAGTDATIYQPSPDLKFINDTDGSILIDTYIDGNKLFFDFYGTDTGRRVELVGPYISNVTDYPEPVYVDTSTLPVGELKKIDTAHRGADAVLYRKIFQNGKLVKTDTFSSHYVPWPAKYLRGAEDATKVETNLNNVIPPAPTDTSSTPSTPTV